MAGSSVTNRSVEMRRERRSPSRASASSFSLARACVSFGGAQRALKIGNLGVGGGLHPGSLVKFWALLGLAMLLLASCKSVPEARVGVASIRFRGNDELSSSELRTRIATQETPKFLGLFRASWRRYDDFEPEVLEKDLERIRHFYERSGYYGAEVRAGRVKQDGKFVEVEILIREGDPVHVRSVSLLGLEGRTTSFVLRVQGGDRYRKGRRLRTAPSRYVGQGNLHLARRHGYAYAEVTPGAVVDLGPRVADVTFQVETGIPCKVGPVTFEGLDDLPEGVVRRTFGLKSGDLFESTELEAGRRALVNLGVFASVEVVPNLSDKKRAEVPIKVLVTRSALRGFRFGGGLLIDFIRTDIHALVGWEHRNLWGGMRRFSVDERPSLIFFPTALSNVGAPRRLLPANAFAMTFNQPAFPEARTTSSLRVEFNTYPIILSPVDPNQQIFPGYNEVRAVVGPERYFPSINFRAAVLYNFQANFPFAYAGEVNPAFNRVLVSYLGLRGQFDLRDDPINTRQGFLVQSSLQFAGGIFQGDADDVRISPEMRMFVPISSSVTLGGRALLGLVFPRNYGSTLGTNFLAIPNDASAEPYIRDLQITYFRGFFSGAPTLTAVTRGAGSVRMASTRSSFPAPSKKRSGAARRAIRFMTSGCVWWRAADCRYGRRRSSSARHSTALWGGPSSWMPPMCPPSS